MSAGKEENGVFYYPVTVQFEEVDSYDIVHHTKLISYLERARVSYLLHRGLDIHKDRCEILLYGLKISFKNPAHLLDNLQVSVSVDSVESFKIRFIQRILKENKLIVKAYVDVAFVDSGTKEIMPAPDIFVS